MKIFLTVMLCLLALLAVLLIYVSWLLFSMACARKIPRIISPLMSKLIGGFNVDALEMVKVGKKFYEEERREPWYIRSHDGLALHAEYIPCENARATIILMHGYRSSALHDFSGVLPYYRQLGLNILLCDQRAHGESEGKYITFGVLERYDVRAWVLEHNKRIGADTPVILDGISMGGATVAYAAGLELPKNVCAVMDDCGYSNPKAQIQYVMGLMKIPVFPFYPVANTICRLLAKFSFSDVDAKQTLSKTDIPCLFIHGEADDFVPCSMGIECHDSCASKKYIFVCPEAKHGMSYIVQTEKCQKMLRDFIDEVLK